MQFNTYLFAVFFAVVLAVHYAPLPWTVKKLALLVESYAFYAAWDPAFVLLLWASTVVDWFAAKAMMRTEHRGRRKAILLVSLVVNLGMLGYFKYAGFFQRTLEALGVGWHAAPDVVLPIGISFYTFMTLSYTIDVYLERAKPARSFLDYALYVTFFPHLVSGPIVRATELCPQFESPRKATGAAFGWGLWLAALGLFEKVVLADGILAPIVDRVYGGADALATYSTGDAWAATLAFAGQIFCDFAGYSTCAIGVALCLGFALPDNFRQPYAAVGFSDFWRRWHISLSTWLRDYLYIPLGGNRGGAIRTQVNLALTMLIGGLWHGASWTFVVWGALHGAYLAVERVLRGRVSVPAPVGAAITFVLVCVAWVFFRAPTFTVAFDVLAAMFGQGQGRTHGGLWPAIAVIAGLLAAHWLMRKTTIEEVVAKTPWPARSAAVAVCVISLFLFSGIDRAFIYFQF